MELYWCSFREIILMKFLGETNTHTETKNSLMSIKHNEASHVESWFNLQLNFDQKDETKQKRYLNFYLRVLINFPN